MMGETLSADPLDQFFDERKKIFSFLESLPQVFRTAVFWSLGVKAAGK